MPNATNLWCDANRRRLGRRRLEKRGVGRCGHWIRPEGKHTGDCREPQEKTSDRRRLVRNARREDRNTRNLGLRAPGTAKVLRAGVQRRTVRTVGYNTIHKRWTSAAVTCTPVVVPAARCRRASLSLTAGGDNNIVPQITVLAAGMTDNDRLITSAYNGQRTRRRYLHLRRRRRRSNVPPQHRPPHSWSAPAAPAPHRHRYRDRRALSFCCSLRAPLVVTLLRDLCACVCDVRVGCVYGVCEDSDNTTGTRFLLPTPSASVFYTQSPSCFLWLRVRRLPTPIVCASSKRLGEYRRDATLSKRPLLLLLLFLLLWSLFLIAVILNRRTDPLQRSR